MKHRKNNRRRYARLRGMSLLEVIIASTILTAVVASVTILLRTGRETWQANYDDQVRLEAAHATVRHIVRRVRQATSVLSVSAASETSGDISLLMESGEVYAWDHDSGTDVVKFGVDTAGNLLGENVTQLKFTGYEADTTTATTAVEDIQSIKIEAQVALPREANGTKTITSWAWIRSW